MLKSLFGAKKIVRPEFTIRYDAKLAQSAHDAGYMTYKIHRNDWTPSYLDWTGEHGHDYAGSWYQGYESAREEYQAWC